MTKQTAPITGTLSEFAAFGSARNEVRKIWFSLYTSQQGESSLERPTEKERSNVLQELRLARTTFPKVYMPDVVLNGYEYPAQSPESCIFAQVTTCISADLVSIVNPCQLGGNPVCSECGCVAASGLAAIGRFRIAGALPVDSVFRFSAAIGQRLAVRRGVEREASRG